MRPLSRLETLCTVTRWCRLLAVHGSPEVAVSPLSPNALHEVCSAMCKDRLHMPRGKTQCYGKDGGGK